MKTQDWRISLYSANNRWKGFTFADTEEKARELVSVVRLPGDWAVVSEWSRAEWGIMDYCERFTVTDEGEETPESWAARLNARCQAAARERDNVG